MPPSQLKQLKASLREQGITGSQSKKRKKTGKAGDAAASARRKNALSEIRVSSNPFDVKAPSRPQKFPVTTAQSGNGRLAREVVGRPGVAKSAGEEVRRRTLLAELQQRHKAGGIVDRRIGENNPHMTPEQKMLERFAMEKQRRKGASLFDLEDDDEGELTHLGQSLGVASAAKGVDDYDAESVDLSSDDGGEHASKKRRRDSAVDDHLTQEVLDGEPDRKKSKAEVMKEVMVNSKLLKYERQQAKEEDRDLREEIDKDLQDTLDALRSFQPRNRTEKSADNDEDTSASKVNGTAARPSMDKDYDARVKQLAQDRRSQPSERTKTDEEKAAEQAAHLQSLEESRLRRMRGEIEAEEEQADDMVDPAEDFIPDDAAAFGLGAAQPVGKQLEVEDEDDFLMDDDLIASQSEHSELDEEVENESSESEFEGIAQDEDDEFIRGILSKDDEGRTELNAPPLARQSSPELPFTYPCPQSHDELLKVLEGIPVSGYPTVVQRIRALYQPHLDKSNKAKQADFSSALVDHIFYMTNNYVDSTLRVVEQLIRHIHSLARTFPESIGRAFRSHLQNLHASSHLNSGHCVILAAIGSIFPTSDHFHQVVTPAITLMSRWLELTNPKTPKDFVLGAYIGALCIKYQHLSKRYIPELVRFTTLALKSKIAPSKLLEPHIINLKEMADLWAGKSAFIEIFSPATISALEAALSTPTSRSVRTHLRVLLQRARAARRPLELHHHRPLPIRTAIPKFEESFNPDKHYDPDRDRAEAARLRAEYKRERKGALRELRKDANFLARESLREKKERDRAYDEKYRRLVAEIQGEEGRERNAYERERTARQRKRKR